MGRESLLTVCLMELALATFFECFGLALLAGKENFGLSLLSYKVPENDATSKEQRDFIGTWALFVMYILFFAEAMKVNFIMACELSSSPRHELNVKFLRFMLRTFGWLMITGCGMVFVPFIFTSAVLVKFPETMEKAVIVCFVLFAMQKLYLIYVVHTYKAGLEQKIAAWWIAAKTTPRVQTLGVTVNSAVV